MARGSEARLVPTVREVNQQQDDGVGGFCDTYIEAFGGPPYFEKYEASWVFDNIWTQHLQHCLLVAEANNKVVGLACAHPLLGSELSKSAEGYLMNRADLPFDPKKTIYISELAVHGAARGHGIGTKLAEAQLDWGRRNGFEYYVLRTAAEGSNSLRLYQRLGAQCLEGAQKVESIEGGELSTESTARIFLWGRL